MQWDFLQVYIPQHALVSEEDIYMCDVYTWIRLGEVWKGIFRMPTSFSLKGIEHQILDSLQR